MTMPISLPTCQIYAVWWRTRHWKTLRKKWYAVCRFLFLLLACFISLFLYLSLSMSFHRFFFLHRSTEPLLSLIMLRACVGWSWLFWLSSLTHIHFFLLSRFTSFPHFCVHEKKMLFHVYAHRQLHHRLLDLLLARWESSMGFINQFRLAIDTSSQELKRSQR